MDNIMKILPLLIIVLLIFSCQQAKTEETIIGSGRITTIIDGYDVRKVNLWSSTSSSRTPQGFMLNGEQVKILKDVDPYYLVKSISGNKREGYCMKGFVILN